MTDPLSEPTPDSLEFLFNLDPLSLTDDHVERIVQAFRDQRERWVKTEAKGKKVKLPATASVEDILDLKNLKL